MATNSIRLHSKTEYMIDVNDNGDTILFDMADTGLPSRLFKMFESIDKLAAELDAKAKEIGDRPDEPLFSTEMPNSESGESETRVLITKNQHDGVQLIDDFYKQARVAMDLFLGEGACQKIFGDKNYNGMFDDLIEQLEPHFKKMGLEADKLKKSAATKYAPNRQSRRSLK